MSREYIQTAPGVFTPVADTQGLLVPQPVRYTRFRPSNLVLDGSATDSNYYIAPTPAQCAAGGGETWNSGSNRFYVPKGGIYTVTFPAYRMSALVDQPTQFARSSNGEWKSFKVSASGAADLATWKAMDISLFVPEGGYVQIGYNTAANTTLQFEGENSVGTFIVYLNEVAAPYIVANKGALVSSDAYGKVKIADDGTMSVNGDIGVGTDGAKYSITRPDKWANGVEINFGDGLYGQRFTGYIDIAKQTTSLKELTSFAVSAIISYGGWWQRGDAAKYSMPSTIPNNADMCWFYTNNATRHIIFGSNTALARDSTTGLYEIWTTYRK